MPMSPGYGCFQHALAADELLAMLLENAHQTGRLRRFYGVSVLLNNGVGKEPVAYPGHGGLGLGPVVAGQSDFQVLADANIGDGVVAQAAQAAEDGLAWGGVDGGFESHIDAGTRAVSIRQSSFGATRDGGCDVGESRQPFKSRLGAVRPGSARPAAQSKSGRW